jgi:ABC-type transport system substrate-binding protein
VTGVFGTLEPVQALAPADRTLHGLLYEGLLAFDQTIRPVPVLADGQPETPDGRVWTVRCRQDITFHDGTPFTCADALSRLESLRANAAVITGGDVDPTTLRALLDRITTLTLVDDHTLTITLSEPFGYVPEALAHPAAAIIRPDGIGTGPYVLASLSETEAALQANLAYRVSPLPAETVVLSTLPEYIASAERITRFGTLYDAMDVAPIGGLPDDAVLLSAPGATTLMLVFGSEDSLASNVGIRRALGMAIDRADIVDQVYGGHARPILSLAPLTEVGYSEPAASAPSAAAMRQTQAEAGWPDGFSMLLYVDADAPNDEALGNLFLDQLEVLYIDGGTAPLGSAIQPPAFALTAQSFPDTYAALNWLMGEGGPAAEDALLREIVSEVQTAPAASERETALAAVRERLEETLPLIPLVAPDACALAAPEAAVSGGGHVRVSPFGWLEIAIP